MTTPILLTASEKSSNLLREEQMAPMEGPGLNTQNSVTPKTSCAHPLSLSLPHNLASLSLHFRGYKMRIRILASKGSDQRAESVRLAHGRHCSHNSPPPGTARCKGWVQILSGEQGRAPGWMKKKAEEPQQQNSVIKEQRITWTTSSQIWSEGSNSWRIGDPELGGPRRPVKRMEGWATVGAPDCRPDCCSWGCAHCVLVEGWYRTHVRR